MKKKILLFLLILFIIPFNVFAGSDDVDKLYVNIDILENGSIKVKELAVLNGDYNGRLRDIQYSNLDAPKFTGSTNDFNGSDIYNGSGYRDLVVYDISEEDFTFDDIFSNNKSPEYKVVTSGYSGQRGVYEKSDIGNGFSLKIYNPSSSGSAFYMEYIIDDVVVVHDDVAEIAWNILGESYAEDINEMEVHVNLPKKDKDLRVWLHGPLNGEIKNVDNKTSVSKFNFVGAYNAVSVRMMFDKSLVPNATKVSGVVAKEKILSVEQKLADEANAIRNRIKLVNNIAIIGTIIWFVLLIVFVILFFIKKKKLEKCDFDMDYLRDFPASYGPETLEYLIRKSISDKSLSASILMIIEKKALKVENIPDKKNNFNLIKQDEYISSLTDDESKLLELIVGEIGNGKTVSLNQIRDYGKSYSKASKFISSYDEWLKSCTKKAVELEFFIKKVPYRDIVVVLCLCGFAITILNTMLETGFILGYGAVFMSFIILIIVLSFKIRTEKGLLEYKQWMALKKFIQDFGTMDEKELPEISIWGKYLVYATVLGCADELEKQMKIRMENMNLPEDVISSYYWAGYYHHNFNMGYVISSSMHQAVSSSRSSIAVSSSSSGGGFGGGSSGGGGSFGGGGGGGRF